MVRLACVSLLIASAAGLAAAQSYSDWNLDPTAVVELAAPANGLGLIPGDVASGKAACDAIDDCLAVICRE